MKSQISTTDRIKRGLAKTLCAAVLAAALTELRAPTRSSHRQ